MKRHLVYTLVILMLLGFIYPAMAKEITKTGTTVAQFLKIGVGARGIGMGGAIVASVNDATALFWNPAMIANFNSGDAIIVHTKWLVDTDFNYIGITLPVSNLGTFGFSATTLTMGDMKVRTVEFPEGTGEYFTARDLAFGVAYARNLTNFFSIGFHGKYIKQQIWHCSSSSIAFDFGTIYHSDNNRIHLGASVSNFGMKMQYAGKDLRFNHDLNTDEYGDNEFIPAMLHTDKWDLPLLFRVGVAVDFPDSPLGNLRLETDAVHPNDNTEQVNIGAEWQILNVFFLRAGYQSLFVKDGEQGLTAGVGFNYKIGNIRFRANYAYSGFGRLSYVERLDIGLQF